MDSELSSGKLSGSFETKLMPDFIFLDVGRYLSYVSWNNVK